MIILHSSDRRMSRGQVIVLRDHQGIISLVRKTQRFSSVMSCPPLLFWGVIGTGRGGPLRGGAQRVGGGTSFSEHDETAAGGLAGPRPQRWCPHRWTDLPPQPRDSVDIRGGNV